jgi:hypothetical protein
MPKDLSKLPTRELAALSGADDEELLNEHWWAREPEEEEEVESKTA